MATHNIIPNVDGQLQILWWEFDEVLIITIFTIFGIAYEMVIYAGAAGLLLSKLFQSAKLRFSDGYHLHWLWWNGILPMVKLKVPNYIKEFYE